MKDDYYFRPETSNSDLISLMKYWLPPDFIIDMESIFRFGSLVDAMITQKHTVDYFKLQVRGEQYSRDEFELASRLAKVFYSDPFCIQIAKISDMQKMTVKHGFKIHHEGIDFELNMRCLFDFFMGRIKSAADLKTTASTSLKGFIECIHHFRYTQQCSLYMDLENLDMFTFIGISKKNFQIFKVPVKRGDELYKIGKKQYEELAWKQYYLFENINNLSITA